MTEMTAAAFREAAEQITRVMCPDTKDLDDAADRLLAAAEQREQWDAMKAELDDARHERELMRVKLARAMYQADTK